MVTEEVVIRNVWDGGVDILYTQILSLCFGKVKYKKKKKGAGGPKAEKSVVRCDNITPLLHFASK